MFEELKSIQFIGVYRYKAKESGHFSTQEPYFLYKLTGNVQYFCKDETFTSAPGDVLLFPQGINFHTKMILPGEYIIMYFSCTESLGTSIRRFPKNEQRDLSKYFLSALSHWSVNDDSSFFLCQSRLYEIVGRLAEDFQISNLPLSERKIISLPVEYMKKHLFESGFSLSKMYELSGVSETHFRKIFHKMYGTSPKRYVLITRINHAANLLLADPSQRVQEVAEMVGYTDAFHFSKVFKRELGITPKDYFSQY